MNSFLSFFKSNIKTTHFALIMSAFNLVFFHYAFLKYSFSNFDYTSSNGILLSISLFVLLIVFNAFAYYLFLSISHYLGKTLMALTFIMSAIATYFINTYNVIIDKSMIGNVINTNYGEASAFFSFKLIVYVVLFGVLPSIYIFKVKLIKDSLKKSLKTLLLTLLLIATIALVNASNWLWIDKNSTTLGALLMPWSYTVNTARYYSHKFKENKKEILLPDATITDDKKAVVVLIIGESARRENFSLYGYKKNTNPLLSETPNVYHFEATSCATYTTAALKCILEHKEVGSLYEILPNYLYRNGVDVVWRSTNWGEPPIHIKKYQKRDDLKQYYNGENSQYDEILLTNLKEQILQSGNNKNLIVLHTSTSHGPTYSKQYPQNFEVFSPVCNSVELGNCSNEELMNAYDNTIVYTDYLLHSTISILSELNDYDCTMIYVSDHGESLGEKNLYMHGVPMSFAPKEQYEIPFIVWMSDSSRQLKQDCIPSQHHIFHSVLNFLSIESPIYDENMNIFQDK